MIQVSLSGTTIPHEVIGEVGAGRVLMKPAPRYRRHRRRPRACNRGSSGYQGYSYQVPALQHRSNVVAATFEGLKALRTPEQVARTRGKSVDEIVG